MPLKAVILLKYQILMKFSLFRMPLITATCVPEVSRQIAADSWQPFQLGTKYPKEIGRGQKSEIRDQLYP
jgi:hypothetical protein